MPKSNKPQSETRKPLRPQDDTNPVKNNPRMKDDASRRSSQERDQRR